MPWSTLWCPSAGHRRAMSRWRLGADCRAESCTLNTDATIGDVQRMRAGRRRDAANPLRLRNIDVLDLLEIIVQIEDVQVLIGQHVKIMVSGSGADVNRGAAGDAAACS